MSEKQLWYEAPEGYPGPVAGAPGQASKRPAPSRGTIFTFAAASPQLTVAQQALRLDEGIWDIRIGRLVNGALVNAPSQFSPTFPFAALLTYGIGAASWTEQVTLIARGMHIVRAAELIELRIRAFTLLGAVAETIVAAAQKIVVATQPPRHILTRTLTIAPAAVQTWPVPVGAQTVVFQGGELDAPLFGTWRDAAAATIGRVLVVPFPGFPPIPISVPTTAADIQWDALPTGATVAANWEVEL